MGNYITIIPEFYMMDRNGNKFKINNINNANLKGEESVEQRLNKYLEENKIDIDENGNFEMYVVVDTDDKDHEIGSIHCGKATEVYGEKRAYEDLKEGNRISSHPHPYFNLISNIEVIKKTTIKEDLLKMKDKIFKVLVNKKNVVNVVLDVVFVNKYKVVESVLITPKLKLKIASITDNEITVILYNNLTERLKRITVKTLLPVKTLDDAKVYVDNYLEQDERRVALINSIADDGVVL